MEPVGVSASETPKQSKKSETGKSKVWFFVLCGLFVVIVGLVIAIVVVKNLPREREETDVTDNNDYVTMVEKYDNYDSIINEISNKINSDQLNTQDTISLYQSYVDNTNNAIVKAMLRSDYYLLLMEQDVEKQWKEDIVNQLIGNDDIIRTENSALIVAMAAGYYQDEELMQQYNSIAAERATTEQRIEDMEGQE